MRAFIVSMNCGVIPVLLPDGSNHDSRIQKYGQAKSQQHVFKKRAYWPLHSRWSLDYGHIWT
jgi:hypothetical protein